MDDLISRQMAIDAVLKLTYADGAYGYTDAKELVDSLEALPPAQPEIKPIDYRDCADAMLMMWMWNVLTDGEYYRIMDKLNKHEVERRNDE